MSVFITFEGGDGSGKSTQVKLLIDFLENQGYDALMIHEPGGTIYGEFFRRLLLDVPKIKKFELDVRTQVLGFCSARAQLMAEQIIPRLRKHNTITLSDRFADSTIAYQVYGGDALNLQTEIEQILNFATFGVKPDVTIFLDIPPEIGEKRREGRIKREEEPHTFVADQQLSFLDSNQFDEKKLTFHRAVRDGYYSLIQRDPKRWWIIDGNRPIEIIQDEIRERVCDWLKLNNIQPKEIDSIKNKQSSYLGNKFFPSINTYQDSKP